MSLVPHPIINSTECMADTAASFSPMRQWLYFRASSLVETGVPAVSSPNSMLAALRTERSCNWLVEKNYKRKIFGTNCLN